MLYVLYVNIKTNSITYAYFLQFTHKGAEDWGAQVACLR